MKPGSARKQTEVFWPRIVLKKWLNISTDESNFSADPDEGDSGSDSDNEEFCVWGRESHCRDKKGDDVQFENNETSTESIPKLRRRNSETLRVQYINTKELRICVGSWNVGGKLPPDDLDIEDWLDMSEHADIYVIGLQEIVPLNAGNIFGAEDSGPVLMWENIIRETLNRVKPLKKFKSYSDPPSPSRFKPTDDFPDIEDEILNETDSDGDGDEEKIHPSQDESTGFDEVKDEPTIASIDTSNAKLDTLKETDLQRQFSSQKRLDRLNCLKMEESMGSSETSFAQQKGKLTKTLSSSERIGLSWPEPPLNFLAHPALEKTNSFKSVKSFRAVKSFRTYHNSFKAPSTNWDNKMSEDLASLTEIDLESVIFRKRKSAFVRIISKQMVGIFLSIWVRRSLRRHIQNLKVSTVGVGVMGYIGNKGSISVSMSIYQTLFCFICTHLTAGEKNGDEHRRNADVHEILRRTQFGSFSRNGLPKTIHDHERIIWFGDLNYRINLTYEKTRELISKKEWNQLVQKDQLGQELKKNGVFDGWTEGTLNFPPTYKYVLNSEKYYGEDPKVGRRTPAWCDRILSYGKGLRLLNYKRIEKMFSDHRPVTATYMAEVEIFCHRKLQKALTFTDAELEDGEIIQDLDFDVGRSRFRFGENISDRER